VPAGNGHHRALVEFACNGVEVRGKERGLHLGRKPIG
jgi:hypothetical protein